MKYLVAFFTVALVSGAQSAGMSGGSSVQHQTPLLFVATQTSQQEAITKELNRCLNLPSAAEVEPYRIVLNVEFDERGTVVDATATDYSKGGVGEIAVMAYTRALERCSPFTDAPHGSLELILTGDPQSSKLNPFK